MLALWPLIAPSRVWARGAINAPRGEEGGQEVTHGVRQRALLADLRQRLLPFEVGVPGLHAPAGQGRCVFVALEGCLLQR